MSSIGIEMTMVDTPKVYRDGFESDAIYGDKTVFEVGLCDLYELGFDTARFGFDEASSSDEALNDLLVVSGVVSGGQKKPGIIIEIAEDLSTADEYEQYLVSLKVDDVVRSSVYGFTRTIVSDCWPFTTIKLDKRYNPLTMEIDNLSCLISTRLLEGRWKNKEQLTQAAALTLLEKLQLRRGSAFSNTSSEPIIATEEMK